MTQTTGYHLTTGHFGGYCVVSRIGNEWEKTFETFRMTFHCLSFHEQIQGYNIELQELNFRETCPRQPTNKPLRRLFPITKFYCYNLCKSIGCFQKSSLYLYVCCTNKSSQSRFCQQPFKAIFCSNCTIAVYDCAI